MRRCIEAPGGWCGNAVRSIAGCCGSIRSPVGFVVAGG
ncbi:uncharacterized protein BCN122_III0714 [Burkholderia cenocepacia]|nr:uncharacterized protein BCN122_III0714 [Burkholderia cenocepacia]